jgi:hypothetical protein
MKRTYTLTFSTGMPAVAIKAADFIVMDGMVVFMDGQEFGDDASDDPGVSVAAFK